MKDRCFTLLVVCVVLLVVCATFFIVGYVTVLYRIDKAFRMMSDELEKSLAVIQHIEQPSTNNNYVLIPFGAYQTFLLRGGKEVAVIDSLSFEVENEVCRTAIVKHEDEIMYRLMQLFLNKTKEELTTTTGVEQLKNQIRNIVNEITGFTNGGVRTVYLYIKTVSSVE